ncbi:MAG: hypothetical protein IAG13_25910 [Deltaproteobacteria bacterium]|nr:hypothetical protein [Nannocystaceae bacterium]
MLRSLGAAALLPVLAGCPSPDAEGKYDAFLEQTEEEREDAANIKFDQGGSLADVNGTFLLALAAVIDPLHPLQFYTTATFTPEAEGGTLALDLQPLSLEVLGTTMPRQPVGDVLPLPAVPVDAAGGFLFTIADPVMVTGEANPITGSDIVATLVLTGSIQSEDLFCGTVTGAVTSPLMLDLVGSTFAAVRVPSVDMLPGDPVTSACPAGGGGETGGTGAGTSDGSGSDSGG